MFAELSDSIVALTAAGSPLLAAVRTGANRHLPGIRWHPDLVVTSDLALPALDSFTLVLPQGLLVQAHPIRRDPALGLAVLRLETAVPMAATVQPGLAAVGRLVLVLGATFDASPTVRLATIHRIGRPPGGEAGPAILLDLPAGRIDVGGPVIDAAGGIVGMASLDHAGEAAVVPYDVVARFLEPQQRAEPVATPVAAAPGPEARSSSRGWLGVALQPTTLPDALRPVAGQTSGRMVISITPKGPAAQAGLRLGDVLLALDGQPVSGPHALRAVIGAERIGRRLDVRLLRDGAIHVLPLVVAPQPTRDNGAPSAGA